MVDRQWNPAHVTKGGHCLPLAAACEAASLLRSRCGLRWQRLEGGRGVSKTPDFAMPRSRLGASTLHGLTVLEDGFRRETFLDTRSGSRHRCSQAGDLPSHNVLPDTKELR